MPGDPPAATRAHPPRPRRPHDPDRTRPPAAPVPADPPRVGRRARGRAGARRRRDLLRVPDPHRLRGVGRGRRRAAPPCRPRARVRRADDRLATHPGPTLGPHPQLGRGVRGRRGQRAPGGRGPRRLGRGARTTPSRHPAGGVDRPDRARRRRGPDVPQRGERRPGRRRTGVPGGLRDLGMSNIVSRGRRRDGVDALLIRLQEQERADDARHAEWAPPAPDDRIPRLLDDVQRARRSGARPIRERA